MNLFLLVDTSPPYPASDLDNRSIARFLCWSRRDLQQWLASLAQSHLEPPTRRFHWLSDTHFSALVPWSLVLARVEVESVDVGMEASQVLLYSGESMTEV